MRSTPPPAPGVLGGFVLVCTLSGCDGTGTVTLEPPRRMPERMVLHMDHAERHGFVTGRPRVGPVSGAPDLKYDVPEGWISRRPSSMRLLSFLAPGEVDISVTLLAGGTLLANVDRWREQMGLPHTDEAAVAALPRIRCLDRDDAVLVDLVGRYTGAQPVIEHARMLAIVVPIEARTLFLKMVGEHNAVDAQQQALLTFAESLHRGDPHAMPPASPGGAAPPGNASHADVPHRGAGRELGWTVPDGFVVGNRSEMRAVTIHPGGDRDVHAYLVILPGLAGGVGPNLDRWLSQVGRPPMGPGELETLPTITVLGGKAPLLEAYGEREGVVGTVARLGQDSLFGKMVGPPEKVRAARAGFVQFVESVVLR